MKTRFLVVFSAISLLVGSLFVVPSASAYEAPEDLYRFLGTVRRIVDGNTITADVDLGFGVWMHKTELRLKGVDTPKVEGETLKEGAAAFEFLKKTLADQERILLQTFWDPTGEYDGWLAVISIWDEDKESWVSVNQMVIDSAHGVATD